MKKVFNPLEYVEQEHVFNLILKKYFKSFVNALKYLLSQREMRRSTSIPRLCVKYEVRVGLG